MADIVPRFSLENRKRLVRLLRHMLTPEGFSEAFNIYLYEMDITGGRDLRTSSASPPESEEEMNHVSQQGYQ